MTQNHVVALVTQLFGPPCKIVGDTSYHLDEAVSVNSKTSQIKVGVEPPMTIDELVDELEKEIEQKNGQNNHTTITQYVKDRTDPHRYRVAPGLEDLPLGDLGAGISDPDPPPRQRLPAPILRQKRPRASRRPPPPLQNRRTRAQLTAPPLQPERKRYESSTRPEHRNHTSAGAPAVPRSRS